MKVSEHFSRNEFQCKCLCGFKAVDVELLQIMEKIRSHFNDLPVSVHCACRCLEHNRKVKSKDTSQHVRGLAIDFHIKGVKVQDIYDYVDSFHDDGGLGVYDTFIHIDVRGSKKRWDMRGGY